MARRGDKHKMICAALALVLSVNATGAVAVAQTSPDDIETRYNAQVAEAARLYEAGDVDGAIKAFEGAYQLRKEPNIIYNIGRLYEEQGKLEEAAAQYEQYVGMPGIELESRQDALERIKTLREILALRKTEDEAKLKRQREEEELKRRQAQPKPEPKADYTMAYVFLGTGVAALAGGGVVGLMADGAHGDFEDATTLDDRRAAADSGKTLSLVADGLLVGGAVLTALGVVFWATASPADEPKEPAQSSRWIPAVGPDQVGVSYWLSF